MRDAADFRLAVAHGVEGFARTLEQAVRRFAQAARLAEVDVAVQLAHDQDIQAGHQFGLQARGAGQFRIADRRTEVGKQLQVLAQAQDGLLGAQRAFQAVVFPVADGAEQDGVRFLGQLQRVLRQRMAFGLVAGAAHGGGFQFELLVERVQDLDGLCNDFGTDAVTRQDCDLHCCLPSLSLIRPGGCSATASSPRARPRRP
ncbi:hypothetical protein FQZ97_802400 [compost metagenome]